MSTDAGIDYGMGITNIDKDTGIRYGVIHHGEVGEAWYESSEPNYIVACPSCGSESIKDTDDGLMQCESCDETWDECNIDREPVSHYLDDGEYLAEQSYDDCDIFITKSPYYTLCGFCSPCAPGAGYLTDSRENGVKSYCFGHDMFWDTEENHAPYTVYRVSDDSVVEPEND